MARSKKKPWYCDSNKGMKRFANKTIRQSKKSIPNGKGYKKLFCSYNICDYKFYCPEDPVAYRK